MACFHILAWCIVLEKNSLIKSSLLNDFNFHLLFYCFSPCPVSLPHMLHVFKPPSTTSTASFSAVVWWSLLWGFHAYIITFGQSTAPQAGVTLLSPQSKWTCCQAWWGIPQQPFYPFLESLAGGTRSFRALVSHVLLELLLKFVLNHRKAQADLKWDLETKQPVLLLKLPRAGYPGPDQLGLRYLHRESLQPVWETHDSVQSP